MYYKSLSEIDIILNEHKLYPWFFNRPLSTIQCIFLFRKTHTFHFVAPFFKCYLLLKMIQTLRSYLTSFSKPHPLHRFLLAEHHHKSFHAHRRRRLRRHRHLLFPKSPKSSHPHFLYFHQHHLNLHLLHLHYCFCCFAL
ncbi:hypothetical protein V8G54_028609 [Vigna mungo]|uniref:Uncharacterized protein n=1 Tax=Vigna mungo TaxID=3915 RepID=A0AAQ3MT28_VIGMU